MSRLLLSFCRCHLFEGPLQLAAVYQGLHARHECAFPEEKDRRHRLEVTLSNGAVTPEGVREMLTELGFKPAERVQAPQAD